MFDAADLASDLEALLVGKLAEDHFRRRYQTQLASQLLDAIWGNLEHYLADAEIRAKDVGYRMMQDRDSGTDPTDPR